MTKGKPAPDKEVLVRVHEPVSVIDLLDVESRSHSWNFNDALAALSRAECGVIVLLHRLETAAELLERARSRDGDPGASGMTLRNYGIGAQILKDLGVKKMRLMALPRRMPSMAGFGLEVTGYLQPGNGK
ncbi:Riboflavin biosynthesis protein RibBA [compost metagenome]